MTADQTQRPTHKQRQRAMWASGDFSRVSSRRWRSLVKRWFAELTAKRLRRRTHRSVDQLDQRLPRLEPGPPPRRLDEVKLETVITPYRDGPLLVRGPFRLVDQDEKEIEVDRPTVALCRCGKSRIRPFCDGSHRVVGFTAPSGRELR